MPTSKFWIRKDRESYLVSGVILTCAIASFVSSYWHFSDRLNVRAKIKINRSMSVEAEQKKLRETQYVAPKLGAGTTRYYRLEDDTIPSVPKLGEGE